MNYEHNPWPRGRRQEGCRGSSGAAGHPSQQHVLLVHPQMMEIMKVFENAIFIVP